MKDCLHRFQLGEVAIFARRYKHGSKRVPEGCEVMIARLGPFPAGYVPSPDHWPTVRPTDYLVDYGGRLYSVCEWQLRKKRPPIPEEVLETFRTAAPPREVAT